jgi:hypothetical protein
MSFRIFDADLWISIHYATNFSIHTGGINGEDRTLNRSAARMIPVYSRCARLS